MALRQTLVIALSLASAHAFASFPWLPRYDPADSLSARIPPPSGHERVPASPGSFGEWLRRLPLKKDRPPVRLYDGRLKGNQEAHHAVLDIDVGNKDLQQCADAVIRLRAEYLYATGAVRDVQFRFTSGDVADLTRWFEGYRPIVQGRNVRFAKVAAPEHSYTNFRNYLTTVFTYAGSASLSRDLHNVTRPADMQIGDVFVQPGFPGHAVIVLDMAAAQTTGKKVFLLGQSYMPAQDIHVLRNTGTGMPGVWYDLDFGEKLQTPEWTFRATDLKRF